MTSVSIKRVLAKDLAETKLRFLKEEIIEILTKWNQNSSKEMIAKTRSGNLPEAEVDAIILTNLLERKKEIENLLLKIEG